MKFRKIAVLFLTIAMILNATGCGVLKRVIDTAQNNSVTGMKESEKQEYYEKLFTEGNYETAGESYIIATSEMIVHREIDNNNYGCITSIFYDGTTNVYMTKNGVYLHTETDASNIWRKFSDTARENIENHSSKKIVEKMIPEIKKVKYNKCQNGFDLVTVFVKNPYQENGEKTLIHTAEVEIEDKKHTIKIKEIKTGTKTNSANVIDGGDTNLNGNIVIMETNTIFSGIEGQISFTILETEDITEGSELPIEFSIDAETGKIVDIEEVFSDETIDITFFHIDTYEMDEEIPNDVKTIEKDKEEAIIQELNDMAK